MSNAELTIIGDGLPPRTLAYLASPYTNYEDGIEIAFRDIARIGARLLVAGVEFFSPIIHSHPLSIYGEGLDPLDREFWLHKDENIMARCDVLIVAEMKSWADSIGIQHEIAFFIRARKTIFQLNPDTMIMRRLVRPASEIEVAHA